MFHDPVRIALALFLATFLSIRGYVRTSLSRSGAIAAFSVGFLTFSSSYLCGWILLSFYLTSTFLTKWRAQEKRRLDSSSTTSRSARQVLACSGLGVLLALVYASYSHESSPLALDVIDFESCPISSRLLSSYVAHYAVCAGDTWASEIGLLSTSEPWFVLPEGTTRPYTFPYLTFRRVPRGTNGGLSGVGNVASIAGGGCVGLTYVVYQVLFQATSSSASGGFLHVIGFSMFVGFLGSTMDSILGATCQLSVWNPETKCMVKHGGGDADDHHAQVKHISGRDLLTNEQVNFISVSLTTAFSGLVLAPFML